MRRDSESRVRSIARYITKKLTEAGDYDSTLSYQVELVATDLLIYRKLREACLSEEEDVTCEETSREGHSRVKINPLFSELQRQSKIVQEGLDKLRMNNKSRKKQKEAGDDDVLGRLVAAMGEDDD